MRWRLLQQDNLAFSITPQNSYNRCNFNIPAKSRLDQNSIPASLVRLIRSKGDMSDCLVSISSVIVLPSVHLNYRHRVAAENIHHFHSDLSSSGRHSRATLTNSRSGLFRCGSSATRFQICNPSVHCSSHSPVSGFFTRMISTPPSVEIHRPVIDPVRPVFRQDFAAHDPLCILCSP